jgi:hypothetical protein
LGQYVAGLRAAERSDDQLNLVEKRDWFCGQTGIGSFQNFGKSVNSRALSNAFGCRRRWRLEK